VRDRRTAEKRGPENPLWYLFAEAVGEAISNPGAMRPI
jgi:hypothetical protein